MEKTEYERDETGRTFRKGTKPEEKPARKATAKQAENSTEQNQEENK